MLSTILSCKITMPIIISKKKDFVSMLNDTRKKHFKS